MEEENEEEEYEYESYSDESDDIKVIINPDDEPDDNITKIDDYKDGDIPIHAEDKQSAFDLDINMLKVRKWKIVGD